VSHDLGAPLRAIDGFSRMLSRKTEDRLTEEEKRQLQIIRSNVQNMGQLIENLLAFSRMGMQSMSFTNVDMTNLSHEVWHELAFSTKGRKVSLRIDKLPIAFADLGLTKQVLINLLTNAIKFTQKREEALIEIGSGTEDFETIYFIRDNGAGFDMKYYDQLFGVFKRLHRQDEYEGTGAGLAIVKRIITRHGGRVWAEGEVDEGATFYFTLPTPQE
jgi:light-regulated signal transduction histidine kinase (bacteriophytochrome)